jgi:dienelactone hydrolase
MTDRAGPRARRGAIEITRHRLQLTLAGANVPGIMLVPSADRAVPAALLLHGYSSTKERLIDSMGRALAARGFACLAIDLPLHGGRDDALAEQARSNPLGLLQHWRAALAEAQAAVHYLHSHEAIAPDNVALIGYSLGGYIALITASKEPRVKAVVLAASGDLPATPWTGMMRTVADPIAAARALNGRPLLMLHGRTDRTIPPEQAERLFQAANEPKELRWYEAGHVLPASAAEDAAEWLGLSVTN